jgi:hypothetical protein
MIKSFSLIDERMKLDFLCLSFFLFGLFKPYWFIWLKGMRQLGEYTSNRYVLILLHVNATSNLHNCSIDEDVTCLSVMING